MSLSIENVATVYGVLMSLAPLLQANKMYERRSSADVSKLYLIVLVIGFSLYLAYGISISNRLLTITNTVSIAATTITLVIALILAKPIGRPPVDDNGPAGAVNIR